MFHLSSVQMMTSVFFPQFESFSFFHFSFPKMVVPKRAAMLLDRIMVALHHALEDSDAEGVQRITDLYKSSRHTTNNARFEKGIVQQLKGKFSNSFLFNFNIFIVKEFLSVSYMIFYSKTGIENDINVFEIPVDVNTEADSNDIGGRHSSDEAVNI